MKNQDTQKIKKTNEFFYFKTNKVCMLLSQLYFHLPNFRSQVYTLVQTIQYH